MPWALPASGRVVALCRVRSASEISARRCADPILAYQDEPQLLLSPSAIQPIRIARLSSYFRPLASVGRPCARLRLTRGLCDGAQHVMRFGLCGSIYSTEELSWLCLRDADLPSFPDSTGTTRQLCTSFRCLEVCSK